MHKISNNQIPQISRWLFYIQIIAVVTMQLSSLPFWMVAISIFIGLWAYICHTTRLHLPSPQFLWLFFFILSFLTFAGQDFRPSTQITIIIFCISALLDLLKPLDKKLCHISAMKLIFLLGISFISSPSKWFTISVLLGIASIISCLFFSNQPKSQTNSFKKMTAELVRISFQTAPIIIGLFVMLPQIIDPKGRFQNRTGITGYSENLDPGRITELSKRNHEAFEAQIHSNRNITTKELYWRGSALSLTKGLKWRKTNHHLEPTQITSRTSTLRIGIKQQRTVGHTLFSLSPFWGVQMDPQMGQTMKNSEGSFYVLKRANGNISYTAFSRLNATFVAHDPPKPIHTQLPEKQSTKAKEVVEALLTTSTSKKDFSKKLLSWFAKNKFRYTLSPGPLRPPTIDNFLSKKQGFCEHYAATYAYMLRMAGIPSRVIVGFHGGERNSFNETLTIKGHDAHAWVEAYFPEDNGWTLVDPTSIIAPARLALGGQRFHFTEADMLRFMPKDWVNTVWLINTYLRSFSSYIASETQMLTNTYRAWFDSSIFAGFDQRYIILILMIIIYFITRKTSSRSDPLDLIFKKFTIKVGVKRLPSETEGRYIARATISLDKKTSVSSSAAQVFVAQYLKVKYGHTNKKRREIKKLREYLKKVS